MMSRLLPSVDHCGHRLLLSRQPKPPSRTLFRCRPLIARWGFNAQLAPYSDLRSRHSASSASQWPAQNAGALLQYLQQNFRDDVLLQQNHDAAGQGPHAAQVLADEEAMQSGASIPSFMRLVEAVQLKDSRKALIYLRHALQEEQHHVQTGIAALPRPFFTEIFRLLDPHHLSQAVDGTAGHWISNGMYERLNLLETVDQTGVRRLYTRVLDRLLALSGILRSNGYELNKDEVACLLRCSGAASEPHTAKEIWQTMVPPKYKTASNRDVRLHTELIKARFLTEPLYTHYDKVRRMVTPRSLHRSRLLISRRRVYNQDVLQRIIRLRKGLYGTIKGSNHVEDLVRVMRKQGPVRRLFRYVLKTNNVSMTPELACAFIVAFGRAGMLRPLIWNILGPCYGLDVPDLDIPASEEAHTRLRSGEKSQQFLDKVFPRLRPNEDLMAAIVEAFGSNGEISIALDLIERISKENTLQIPTKVWTDLLEWTYIFGSRPVAPMWLSAAMPSKVPMANAIDVVWETMRATEKDTEPNFEQLSIMARAHLGRGRRQDAYVFMRAAWASHEAHCEEWSAATYEYVQALRDGAISNDTILRYERARFLKQAQWWRIQTLCRKMLSSYRPLSTRIDDIEGSQFIPAFVEEFRDFMPNPFQYRTATGYINMFDPDREVMKDVGEGYSALPMKTLQLRSSRSVDQPLTVFKRRNRLFLSRHSLESQWSAKMSPERLLGEYKESFLTTGKISQNGRARYNTPIE